jgi:glutamyl-tRNA reductase
MERLVNAVIQASKKSKTILRLVQGYICLFAAVQYIMKNVEDVGNKTFFVWNRKKLD